MLNCANLNYKNGYIEMMQKKTLIIGASPNPLRYSYKAVKKLKEYNVPVAAIGKHRTLIDDVVVETAKEKQDDIHTVSIYLSSGKQKEYIDYVFALRPQRIIFNPGTCNLSFEELAKEENIEVVHDCTLRMLGSNEF